MAIPAATESPSHRIGEYGPFFSAGAPTTQFNGVAAKGAKCRDTTNGVDYINTGTKASNTWTVTGTQT
jgi:hypothetical protein